MENKKYIVGIILDNNKKVGVALYSLQTGRVELQSLAAAIEDFLQGGKIIGLKHNKQTVFQAKGATFVEKNYPQLAKHYFDTRRLPIIDCTGKVVKAGAEVCIGTIGTDEAKQYIVVNSSGELRFLNKEEVVKEKPVGTVDGKIIKDCKNVYMTLEEFNKERIL